MLGLKSSKASGAFVSFQCFQCLHICRHLFHIYNWVVMLLLTMVAWRLGIPSWPMPRIPSPCSWRLSTNILQVNGSEIGPEQIRNFQNLSESAQQTFWQETVQWRDELKVDLLMLPLMLSHLHIKRCRRFTITVWITPLLGSSDLAIRIWGLSSQIKPFT